MKTHKVKCWPEPFKEVKARRKKFEMRFDDRNYQVGDIMIQHEWNPETGEFTGEFDTQEITYVLRGEQWGVKEGYVAISLDEIDREEKLEAMKQESFDRGWHASRKSVCND